MNDQFQPLSPASETGRDKQLWRIARKRAAFKQSLVIYFFVNMLLVAVWFFSSGPGTYFWPIWPMLGWGLGLSFQYAAAYHSTNLFSAEQEYEKLKKENSDRQP